MGVTRLKRKGLRNKARAKQRNARIKQLTKKPPVKQVDVEAIKAEFEQKGSAKPEDKKPEKAEATQEAPVKKDAAKDLVDGDTSAEQKEPAKAQVKDVEASEEPKKDNPEEEKK
ncbi:MAG: hypothetical protein ACLFUB_10475 [Cyclobacteriaceae bacterium]